MADKELFGNAEQLDTISRAGALDALNGIEISRNASWYEFYQKAITAVGTLPPAQRWIPVTPKTLPKKVGDYLVTTHSGQIARYIYMGNGSSKDYWMRCVLAWMPLPEPYKEHADAD